MYGTYPNMKFLVAQPAYLSAIVLRGKLTYIPQGTSITASLSLPWLAMVFHMILSLVVVGITGFGALILWTGQVFGLYLLLAGVMFGAIIAAMRVWSFTRFSDQRVWLVQFLKETLEAQEVSDGAKLTS